MLRIMKVKNPFRGNKKKEKVGDSGMELTIPKNFRCPISLDLMKDPVILCTGITYDRQSIETWIGSGNRTCPVTKQDLDSQEQIPNHSLRRMIQDWCVANHSFGIDRIPTPKIPVKQAEVSKILQEIRIKCELGDFNGCHDLVRKISELGRESESNRRCIASAGAAPALAGAFHAVASSVASNNNDCDRISAKAADHHHVLEAILSAIVWMFPLEEEEEQETTWLHLQSPASLQNLFWILNSGSVPTGRRNAALTLKELASSGERHAEALAEGCSHGGDGGGENALVKAIKQPISRTTTKAILIAIYHVVSSPHPSLSSSASPWKEKAALQMVEMGLVHLLLEMLVDSDNSTSEKALGVLDGLLSFGRARKEAYGHALAVPVVVRKMSRGTELATEFAVSVLWKLCKNCGEVEDGCGVVVEAITAGLFQKVLLLLQVACGEATKEKATELLKMLNVYRENRECIESMDFKQLKRPF